MKNKKVAIILIILAIILIAILLVFNSLLKNNDDLASFTSKEYDKVYDINSDIYNFAVIKNELTAIANECENGVKLTFAQYNLEADNKTAEFQFYNNDYGKQNKACVVTIYVDINAKQVSKIKYEKRYGKRVNGYSREIEISEDISNYINPEENIQITITADGIELCSNGKNIEVSDFVKDITNDISEKNYSGVITDINSNEIVFENQTDNKKYSIDISENLKFINGRTNEEININSIKNGYFIDTYTYKKSNVITILSNITGEGLKSELMKNFALEDPIYVTVSPIGTNIEIINDSKAILTITFGDLMSDYNNSDNFEMKVEINSNTVIKGKGFVNPTINDLKDFSLDIIKIRLDESTINDEIPKAIYFDSSNGN